MSGNTIRASLDELVAACDTIHEEFCINCPIEGDCLREVTLERLWNEVSEARLQEFIDLADRYNYPEEEMTEEDYRARYEDAKRKADIEMADIRGD